MNKKNKQHRTVASAFVSTAYLHSVLLLMTWIPYVHAVTLVPEGEYYKALITLEDTSIFGPMNPVQGASTYNPGEIQLVYDQWGQSIGMCTPLLALGSAPTWEQLLSNKTDNSLMAIVRQETYARCRVHKKYVKKGAVLALLVGLVSYPLQRSAAWFLENASIVPDPLQCSAALNDSLAFGVVRTGTQPKATVSMNVTCNQSATVQITVNQHQDLVDPETGTIVSFVQPASLNCAGQCSVPITGTMLQVPSSSGQHKWHAPVTVEYQ